MNTNPSSPTWQILGELEIPIGVSTDDAVHAWLSDILAPINLSLDFLERVMRSAQEAVGHVIKPNAECAVSHIHISIFVPHDHFSAGKSWGFFHIEKVETGTDGSDGRHHAIDFYLYVEGE